MARTPAPPEDDFTERIVDIDVSSEMQTSFLEYAYSVIYSRALPAARDGLELPGYLTLPGGVAPRNLPMVLLAVLHPTWTRPEPARDRQREQTLERQSQMILTSWSGRRASRA